MKKLIDLEIDEISLVDSPANQYARVTLCKRNTGEEPGLTAGQVVDKRDDAVAQIYKARTEVEDTFDEIVRQHQVDGETFAKAYSRILDSDLGRAFYAKRDEIECTAAVVRKARTDALRV